MKIVVNCFPITDKRTGIGHYAYQLLHALARLEEADLQLLFARDAGARRAFAGEGVKIIEAPLLARQSLKRIAWENLVLPRLLRERGADIYFSPDYVIPMTRLPCPAVLTIHDLAFITLPGTNNRRYGTYLRLTVPAAARKAAGVIAISDYTKGEVVRLLGVREEKVRRIYYGRDEGFERPPDGAEEEEVCPYILFVGTLDRRKNIPRLLEAFSILKREGGFPHRLLLAGPRKYGYQEVLSTVRRLGLEGEVCEEGYVERDMMKGLYRRASLLVLPSLHEGFGLPLLEAMASGTPIAASNVTSIPEVAGDAAAYFDPLDVRGMAGVLRGLLEDAGLRASLVKRGRDRLRLFSWEKCARETMDLFGSLACGR